MRAIDEKCDISFFEPCAVVFLKIVLVFRAGVAHSASVTMTSTGVNLVFKASDAAVKQKMSVNCLY